jgi:hypothetical protein
VEAAAAKVHFWQCMEARWVLEPTLVAQFEFQVRLAAYTALSPQFTDSHTADYLAFTMGCKILLVL